MKTLGSLVFFLVLLPPLAATPLIEFRSVSPQAVDASQGSDLLKATDSFLASLSPFDIASRSKDQNITTLGTFVEFLSQQTLDWTPAEKQKLQSAWAKIGNAMNLGKPLFPSTILFVKTTGREEGGAAYCRGLNVICLPESNLAATEDALTRTICHELFHLLTRNSPQIRSDLYATIGFRTTQVLVLPGPLARKRITNPDAHSQDSVFEARLKDGTSTLVMPVLLASRPYDFQSRAEFFEYLSLVFLAVQLDASNVPQPRMANEDYLTYSIGDLQNFFDKVGRNTNYIIDPEEILADNFVLLVLGGGRVKSPQVIEAVRNILIGGRF